MSIDVPTRPLTSPTAPPIVGSRSWTPTVKRPVGGKPRWGLWAAAATLILIVAGTMAVRLLAPARSEEVLSHTVQRGRLVVSVTEQGTLESSNNREIKCKVKGGSTVISVVENGTHVQPGDILIRLDTSTIEDNINQQRILYETALSNKTTSENNVAVAKIGITEYVQGTYQSELATKQKDLVIAQSALKSAQNALDHSEKMFRKGYISELELATQKDAVKHAELDVLVKQTDVDALQKFTRAKELQTLESALAVAQSQLASDNASLELERARLQREQQQLENCVIRADAAGLVIYPSAAEWKETPDIEEGAAVREDQILLIMPDLQKMQVKVGIHESKVDRVKPGMKARVKLRDGTIDGEVHSVATVTRPSGWWTGNLVKYDTIIKLAETGGLKPGMTVAAEVFLAEYDDALTVPVAAVVEQQEEFFCWVDTGRKLEKRRLKLGDSNERFIVVEDGVAEGERVVLNPFTFVEEARLAALKPAARDSADEKNRPNKEDLSNGSKKIPDQESKKSASKDATK